MKISSYAFSLLFASALFSVHAGGQEAKNHRAVGGGERFATRWEMSKGGIGMINRHLYVVVKSSRGDKNELILTSTKETEERWHGKGITESEVAVFYDGKIWSSASLPMEFDLSKAVVVSFESDKVRFFDFQTMTGAYFDRIKE